MHKEVDWSNIWQKIRSYVLNKYVLALMIFAVVIGFVGEQSLRVRIRKAVQIHQLEKKRDAYNHSIEEAKRTIQTLSSTDSLERYAREHYLMHTDKEEVFLVNEDD